MELSFDDYFLPSYIVEALQRQGRWQVLESRLFAGITIRHLRVDGDVLQTIARELRRRRDLLLRGHDLHDRESLLERMAGLRLLAREIGLPGAPLRREMLELLPHLSRFSEKMIGILLDSLVDLLVRTGWAAASGTLPPGEAARKWVETAEGYARYYPGLPGLSWPGLLALSRSGRTRGIPVLSLLGVPALVSNIAAGNVPGIAFLQALLAVSVGAASLGKNSSDEPYMGPRLLQELATLEAQRAVFPLSDLVALVTFSGTEHSLLSELIHQGDHLQATGGADSRRTIAGTVGRLRLRGGRNLWRRVSGHWHKISFDVVARQYLAPPWGDIVAANVALDNGMFNTQGCLSAQQVLVEGERAEVLRFCEQLMEQMQGLLGPLPKGAGPHEGLREMYLSYENRPGVLVLTPLSDLERLPFFVAYEDRPASLPAFSALNRSILIRRVDRLETDLPLLLGRGRWRDLLQSCGVAVPRERLLEIAEALGRAGVNRIVAAGDIWNLRLGRDSWDGYLALTDLLAPQSGYWTTLAFKDPEGELRRVRARNEALLRGASVLSNLAVARQESAAWPLCPAGTLKETSSR